MYKQLSNNTELTTEELENIAELIYDTDPYIYPAMFETKQNALAILPELIRLQDEMFQLNNIFVAKCDSEIVGIVLWKKGSLDWNKEKFLSICEHLAIPISPYLDYVDEKYFQSYKEKGDVISLINICVSAKTRGLGIGSQMMEQFMKLHHGEKIELCVLEKNMPAMMLYTKNGFYETERHQGFSVDNQDIVCIEMRNYT